MTSTTDSITNGTFLTDWHKTLLWFLGALAVVAIAGPAPRLAIMLLAILIVGVLLGHWNDSYKSFFGLK